MRKDEDNERKNCQKYKNEYSATGHESAFFSKEVYTLGLM